MEPANLLVLVLVLVFNAAIVVVVDVVVLVLILAASAAAVVAAAVCALVFVGGAGIGVERPEVGAELEGRGADGERRAGPGDVAARSHERRETVFHLRVPGESGERAARGRKVTCRDRAGVAAERRLWLQAIGRVSDALR